MKTVKAKAWRCRESTTCSESQRRRQSSARMSTAAGTRKNITRGIHSRKAVLTRERNSCRGILAKACQRSSMVRPSQPWVRSFWCCSSVPAGTWGASFASRACSSAGSSGVTSNRMGVAVPGEPADEEEDEAREQVEPERGAEAGAPAARPLHREEPGRKRNGTHGAGHPRVERQARPRRRRAPGRGPGSRMSMLRWPQRAQKASTRVDPQFRQAAGRGRVSRAEGTGRGLREDHRGERGGSGEQRGQVTSRTASTGPLP